MEEWMDGWMEEWMEAGKGRQDKLMNKMSPILHTHTHTPISTPFSSVTFSSLHEEVEIFPSPSFRPCAGFGRWNAVAVTSQGLKTSCAGLLFLLEVCGAAE